MENNLPKDYKVDPHNDRTILIWGIKISSVYFIVFDFI